MVVSVHQPIILTTGSWCTIPGYGRGRRTRFSNRRVGQASDTVSPNHGGTSPILKYNTCIFNRSTCKLARTLPCKSTMTLVILALMYLYKGRYGASDQYLLIYLTFYVNMPLGIPFLHTTNPSSYKAKINQPHEQSRTRVLPPHWGPELASIAKIWWIGCSAFQL